VTHRYLDQALTPHARPPDSPVTWRIGVYALIERNGKVLLVDQIVAAGPGMTLPGGGVELEETIIEGSVREVYEETGYRFTPDPASLTFIEDFFIRSPSGKHHHALAFLVRGTVSDAPDPPWRLDQEEIIEVLWVDPGTLTRDDVRRLHWEVLERLGYVSDSG
jgi:8-oxo-dGTP pyrophosphatase MutT (NUDIX family)